MKSLTYLCLLLGAFLFGNPINSLGQNAIDSVDSFKGLQYPIGLANANFGVSLGYLQYHFTNAQLESGFKAESIQMPPLAVKVNLLGIHLSKYFGIDIHYLRPVLWVSYKNINGDKFSHSVTMNIGGLTLHGQVPLYKKLWGYGDVGLGIVTRSGFKFGEKWALKPSNLATVYLEGGLRYRLNPSWELGGGVSFVPGNKKHNQPASKFYALGFTYYLRPISEEKLEKKAAHAHPFPKNALQVQITPPGLGYGVNDLITVKSPIPLFWDGSVRVKSGLAVHYHRNIFHTARFFSLDWGASAGFWKTRIKNESFFSLSVFPIFRLNFLHTNGFNPYFFYSVAGPTFLSKSNLDDRDLGKKFIFQDQMGLGAFIGRDQQLNLELNIGHFSNGNIFTENPGVTIPVTLGVGYAF